MAGFRIEGNTSGNVAEVDSANNLRVNLRTDDPDSAGYAVASGEVTDGSSGVARTVRPHDVSPDYRLRVGLDSVLWNDVLSHAVFNTSRYLGVTSTMTITQTGGRFVFNGGSSTASGAVSRMQTYRSFPVIGTYPIYVDMWIGFAAAPQTNNVCEFGLGIASGTTAPTDGVFFRLNGAGELRGVVNNNGAETQTNVLTAYTLGEINHYLIVVHNDRTEFWKEISGVPIMLGYVDTPTANSGPCLSQSLPLLMRCYNSAATSSAQQMYFGAVNISTGDAATTRLWATQQSGMGLSSIQAPDGTTVAMTANFANSAAAASATLSNTAAGYTTLGGRFQFAAVAGAETDYALFAYLVPAGTAAIPGKTLMVRGVRIETFNTGAAVATTATVLEWVLGVGTTAVSLATTDSATGGTRGPRRLALGVQSFAVGAAIGAAASPVDVNLDAPIMVEPGSYLHIILKMPIGTATASQIVRGLVMVNGYFE